MDHVTQTDLFNSTGTKTAADALHDFALSTAFALVHSHQVLFGNG
jgi:hypothetical protein